MEEELGQLAEEFVVRFGIRPRLFQAPGRVNLIGEHTDYNDGFVMPFAIDRRTVAGAALRSDTKINVHANDLNEEASFDLADPAVFQRKSWVDYVEGSVRSVAERFGVELRGADLMIASNVPIGAGLSSSAAIEIAVGYALLAINEVAIDNKELAFAGQQAEHKFVGIRSGIMDQFAAVFGKQGRAMLLDCRSLEIDYVPIEDDEIAIAVIDTKVKHNLASSEYNTRREECETGVAILRKHEPGIRSLRDVTAAMLEKHRDHLPDTILKRCRHVVSENDRTIKAAEAFRRREFGTAGRLMTESHLSLKEDYEVSCPELDRLVDTAMSVNGVFGSRMTGGGFGGCTVNLVEKRSVENLEVVTREDYLSAFGFEPDFYLFRPANGASEIVD